MSIGLIGRKCGMTRVFNEAGDAVPVTVIHAAPNIITQIKSTESDGYLAVQVTAGTKKRQHVSKPEAGHYARAKVEAGRGLWELRVADPKQLAELQLGSELTVAQFEAGQKVDVVGTSKGCGFAGAVKRHNFATQDATHGNSLSHRAPGSIGQNQTPGKVFKGKRMAGHMGNVRRTQQGLTIVAIDAEKHLLLVKGGIPGKPGSDVVVKSSVKAGGRS